MRGTPRSGGRQACADSWVEVPHAGHAPFGGRQACADSWVEVPHAGHAPFGGRQACADSRVEAPYAGHPRSAAGRRPPTRPPGV